MTTQFVLVRHATCAQMDEILLGRQLDSALDAHGVEQASALAQSFSQRPIDPAIYSSPRRRTRETAAAIAARSGADVHVHAELDEIDFGSWAGRTFASLESDIDWRAWNTNRAEAATPGGETIASVQQRALALLHAIAAAEPSHPVVIVTHSEIIRSLLFYCLDVSPNHYGRLAIDPASGSTVEFFGDTPLQGVPPSSDRFRIVTVNERLGS